MSPELEILRGTLDVILLRALTLGPLHGYGVSRWIRDRTHDELTIEEGALYPALHRMEHRGWISAEWGVSENNRRAKYYRLTPLGRRTLKARTESWERLVNAVGKILYAPSRA